MGEARQPWASPRCRGVTAQMNEPPGNRPARGADRPDQSRSPSATRAATCCYSSWTTSTATRWPAPKCPPCWADAFGRGLPPTLAGKWAGCRSASPPPRSVRSTSIQAVYVPADDLTDPSPPPTFRPPGRHRGAVARQSPRWASTLRWTRWDSTSRQVDPNVGRRGPLHDDPRGAGHAAALQGNARHHRHPGQERTVAGSTSWPWRRARKIPAPSCRNPSTSRKCFTGTHRQVRVAVGDDPRLQDDRGRRVRTTLPEQAVYMVGTIDEAFEKAKKLAA